MKTIKDVVAYLIAQNDERSTEAANVILQAIADKELTDTGMLEHIATVGKDYGLTMNYVTIREGVVLQDYANQPLYCRKSS